MDITVHTGATKVEGGDVLLSRSYVTKSGEHVLLLVQVYADDRHAQTFFAECERVVQHALVETDGESWTRLDGALKEMNGLMKGLLLSHALDEVHAIMAVLEPNGTMHVSHAGRGEAYLVRHGTTTQITEFTRGKPLSAFVHIASGPLEVKDTVIASTQRLLRAFTPAQLAQSASRGGDVQRDILRALDSDGETASFAIITAGQPGRPRFERAGDGAEEGEEAIRSAGSRRSRIVPKRRSAASGWLSAFANIPIGPVLNKTKEVVVPLLGKAARSTASGVSHLLSRTPARAQTLREKVANFMADLRHPERKKRAHLLLLACAVAAFLIIILVVKLSVSSQRSKTRAELSTLVQRINEEIKTADNRRLAGDMDSANQILQRADSWAKQVMDNESGLFRVEALDLVDRIRSKQEEINNVLRVSPRVLVNLTSKGSSVSAQGMIGQADGEFVVFDRQQWYHVLLNGVDDPKPLTDDGLVLDGTNFPRYKTQVFLTTGNSVLELQGNQPVSMKTDDLAGWAAGKDAETYQRYLYILGTDNGIYKYERLNNRYGPGVQYNVNGDLTGALDMTIDSSIYVLKEGGGMVKLLRGEAKPFSIRHAPADALKTVTKVLKVTDRDFYFLDPVKSRVIVTSDGGGAGESTYLKQYVLEGEQIGKLQDFYVDPDESHLYVMDEKRVYVIDLVK